MKIAITITKEEQVKTINHVFSEPCEKINCEGINCENCPLQTVAENIRIAQDKFISALNSIAVAEE